MFNTFLIIFIDMIYCHILDDFVLQGILKDLKQKKFWDKYGEKYKNDYKVALFIHSLSWSISIMIPIIIYSTYSNITRIEYDICMIIIIINNIFLHYRIDDAKANKYKINLITDQILHFIQIVFTFIWFVVAYYIMINHIGDVQ